MSSPTRFVVASQRPWNAQLAERLAARTGLEFVAVRQTSELTPDRLAPLAPRYIFFAHWSSRIPSEIWQAHECVIFHMTDVPYGRGGSPLQNLIVRGHTETVISALRCVEAMDAGPVYLKRPLSLAGTAEEIFIRADCVIEEMIVQIIEHQPTPVPQEGEPTLFRRRGPADGDLAAAASIDQWFDGIRMLDAAGYPPAFVQVGPFRLEFTHASRRTGGVEAHVMIRRIPGENTP